MIDTLITKQTALANFLGIEEESIDDLVQTKYDNCIFEYGREEYMVLDDDEAQSKWDEELDHYIEEFIIPELPEAYRNYFDYDAWKHDARMDGRGHSLSSYDGNESEQDRFYIYRMN